MMLKLVLPNHPMVFIGVQAVVSVSSLSCASSAKPQWRCARASAAVSKGGGRTSALAKMVWCGETIYLGRSPDDREMLRLHG